MEEKKWTKPDSPSDEEILKMADEWVLDMNCENKFAHKKSFVAGLKRMRDSLLSENLPPIAEVKYGDYVQMDDRLETVHIWSKEVEKINAGRWKPLKITKEKYEQEKAKGY